LRSRSIEARTERKELTPFDCILGLNFFTSSTKKVVEREEGVKFVV